MKQPSEKLIQQNLISAYIKAPMLLARRLAEIFSVYESTDMLAIHNNTVEEIEAVMGCSFDGWSELFSDIAQLILSKGESNLGKKADQKTGING